MLATVRTLKRAAQTVRTLKDAARTVRTLKGAAQVPLGRRAVGRKNPYLFASLSFKLFADKQKMLPAALLRRAAHL